MNYAENQDKPIIHSAGHGSNIFDLLGAASQALKASGLQEQAREMFARITQCQSYDSALSIIGEYVTIPTVDDISETQEEGMVM